MEDGPYLDWLTMLRAIDLPWCVVVARQGRETAVQTELALAGWSTYLPMQTIWFGKGPRRGRRRIPLFSRYLFAACNEGGDLAIESAFRDGRRGREVDGLVSIHRPSDDLPPRPRAFRSAVRLDLLARMMLTEAAHGFDLTYQKPRAAKKGLVCGQEVTVRAGAMSGLEALIVRVLSEREVVARLPISMCGKDEMVFNAADLEPLEPSVAALKAA